MYVCMCVCTQYMGQTLKAPSAFPIRITINLMCRYAYVIYSETCVIRTLAGEKFCVRFRQVFNLRDKPGTYVHTRDLQYSLFCYPTLPVPELILTVPYPAQIDFTRRRFSLTRTLPFTLNDFGRHVYTVLY
jgi:hypothetical protein